MSRICSQVAMACAVIAILAVLGCNSDPSIDYQQLPTPVNEPVVGVSSQVSPRDVVTTALGQIGTPAVPALSAALGDSDPIVRVQACRALAYMGVQAIDAVPALIAALHDPQEAVQVEAAIALGSIGEPAGSAVPRLMEILRSTR